MLLPHGILKQELVFQNWITGTSLRVYLKGYTNTELFFVARIKF